MPLNSNRRDEEEKKQDKVFKRSTFSSLNKIHLIGAICFVLKWVLGLSKCVARKADKVCRLILRLNRYI